MKRMAKEPWYSPIRLKQSYLERVAKFKQDHGDWHEVVDKPIPLDHTVAAAIQEQENGPELVYYLGKHPDCAEKLSQMTPLSAVMELGRISEKLRQGA